MNDTGAKQQIVEKIKDSSNIMVTVSTNPSVDELSAALGLTVLLNKMNKHATAVFSGSIPPAITFLDPQKTFENTVDSLRDFIIALDKEKADHLRYKVDGDVVKIFITPYRTTITSDDLDFSQGDYNVELVLALGVRSSDELDAALEAHGRILHDATVVTLSLGDEKSELGSIDWREQNASSLSEMLVSLVEGMKTDKKLIDEQVATAFLTGIVAATDRFSNSKTSSRVMTVAAQLMAAGANQQLIASKLEEANEIGVTPKSTAEPKKESENSDGTTTLSEGESTKLDKKPKPEAPKEEKKPKDDGSLTISHEKVGDVDEVAKQTERENQEAAAKAAEEKLTQQPVLTAAEEAAEQNLAQQLGTALPTVALPSAKPSVADLQKDLAEANAEMTEDAERAPSTAAKPASTPAPATWEDTTPPSMGGTLNATTEQAAEDARRAIEDDRNRTILSHGALGSYVGDQGSKEPSFQSPLNATMQPASRDEMTSIDPFVQTVQPAEEDTAPTVYAQPVQPPAPSAPTESLPVTAPQVPDFSSPMQPPSETLEDIDKQNRAAAAAPHEDARAAVDAAFSAVPPAPADNPFALPAAADLPPLPDFSTLPPPPPAPDFSPAPAPSGALPPDKLEDMLAPAPAPAQPQGPVDPGQYKIPGQP